MPLWFTILLLVIVTVGLVALLAFIARIFTRAHSGRMALLLVLLAFVATGVLLPTNERHLGRLHLDLTLLAGLLAGILLVVALAFLARPGPRRRWLELRSWLVIAAIFIIAAAAATAALCDGTAVIGWRAVSVLLVFGLGTATILVLTRRSLQDGRESRSWARTALVLWPLLFAIASVLYVVALERPNS